MYSSREMWMACMRVLDEVGDGAGGFGFYFAAHHAGDEAGECGTEIAGGEIVAGEKAGEIFAEFFSGLSASLLLGVIETEVGMVAGAGSAATAAIGESEQTEGYAVLWT
jgi:hypothetical protein